VLGRRRLSEHKDLVHELERLPSERAMQRQCVQAALVI